MKKDDNFDTVNLSSLKEFVDKNNEINKVPTKTHKKHYKIFFVIVFFMLGIASITFFFYFSLKGQINIKNVELLEYDKTKKIATLKIDLEDTLFDNDRYCYGNDKSLVNNNNCIISLEKGAKEVTIENSFSMKQVIDISDYVNKALVFEAPDKIYLAKNDTYKLDINIDSFVEGKLNYEVSNDVIEITDDFIVKGKKDGKSSITLSYLDETKKIDVVVSSLITKKPKHFDYKKDYLACNRYSSAEAKLLDEILEFRINEKGYKTRAGVVEAARFLSLEFPYRIDYFFENGRVSDTGVHYADGEGRYYHKGLYLHEDKFSSIEKSFAGPAIWGCPLMNFEDAGYWQENTLMPNGLDCSGFVTWALFNGGFDIGDIGAGDTPEPNQLTDKGQRETVTKELIESGKVKVGDLINWWGHIAIIIGIDDDKYYIAESLDTFFGLAVKEYTKEEMPDSWTYIMLMDSVYQEDGNLTNMWY